MIHIIDDIEYPNNPLECKDTAAALLAARNVLVVDEWGEILYDGDALIYAQGLIDELDKICTAAVDQRWVKKVKNFVYSVDLNGSNVIYLDEYRQ